MSMPKIPDFNPEININRQDSIQTNCKEMK